MTRTEILRQVADGRMDVAEAERRLNAAGGEADLGFARVDLDRPRRCGLAEVIFGEGKTPAQMVSLVRSLAEAKQPVFATRVRPEQHQAVAQAFPEIVYHAAARVLSLPGENPTPGIGRICVVCAGTSDIPVAEEAALTAAWMGAEVERVFDVGVAGLHRLTRRLDQLHAARVLIVVAGMEGALPSVVGGLVSCPIIAVPTSIGYGMNLGGVTTLLAMMNSCVPGVTVVNVDNGFGAGVAAGFINRLGEPAE